MKEKEIIIHLESRTERFHKHGDWDSIELGFSICENFDVKNAAKHTYRWCTAIVENGEATIEVDPDKSGVTENEMNAIKALAEMYAAGYHKVTGDYGNLRVKLTM